MHLYWQLRWVSPTCKLAARPRRVVSETTFDGTLIPETSFETLRSEDSLAKRVDAFGVAKPTVLGTLEFLCGAPPDLSRMNIALSANVMVEWRDEAERLVTGRRDIQEVRSKPVDTSGEASSKSPPASLVANRSGTFFG